MIGADVAAGLAHLHQSGHVHRDLKPDNILVAVHGDVAVWKVGDLGLLGTDAATSGSRTLHGNRLYRAPEQWNVNRSNPRHAKYSVRADVWSFGILLLDMLDFLRFGPRVRSDPRSGDRIVATLCKALIMAHGILTDDLVWRHVRAYFAVDAAIAGFFADGTPLGEVLRRCLRVDPKERITMQQAARFLRGEDLELLREMAAAALPGGGDTAHGLQGPLDDAGETDLPPAPPLPAGTARAPLPSPHEIHVSSSDQPGGGHAHPPPSSSSSRAVSVGPTSNVDSSGDNNFAVLPTPAIVDTTLLSANLSQDAPGHGSSAALNASPEVSDSLLTAVTPYLPSSAGSSSSSSSSGGNGAPTTGGSSNNASSS